MTSSSRVFTAEPFGPLKGNPGVLSRMVQYGQDILVWGLMRSPCAQLWSPIKLRSQFASKRTPVRFVWGVKAKRTKLQTKNRKWSKTQCIVRKRRQKERHECGKHCISWPDSLLPCTGLCFPTQVDELAKGEGFYHHGQAVLTTVCHCSEGLVQNQRMFWSKFNTPQLDWKEQKVCR